ncbi:Hypothetical protein PYTT_1484 [Akkermansia glycaniphila]|uniref:Uncharacterized protein n=2 Tax=Akkermansia glycaniphila TaxID=1679444 RepID=A0A1H6LKC1_9BACT|nr:Hypothetical protein PYTT_1484 [Akkermansia glycaniphila]
MLACGTLTASENENTYYLDFGINSSEAISGRNHLGEKDDHETTIGHITFTINDLIANKGSSSGISASYASNSQTPPANTPLDLTWNNTNVSLDGINTSSGFSDVFCFVSLSNLKATNTYSISLLMSSVKDSMTIYTNLSDTATFQSASYYQNLETGEAIPLDLSNATSAGTTFHGLTTDDILIKINFTGSESFTFGAISNSSESFTLAGLSIQENMPIPEASTAALSLCFGMSMLFRRRRRA